MMNSFFFNICHFSAGRVQEHLLHRVGRGRPRQDPTAVAALLPEHAGTHLRHRLERPRAYHRGSRRAPENGDQSLHYFRGLLHFLGKTIFNG